jgi:mRNA-decapping enzyme 1B
MTKINLNVNEQARKEANLRLLKRSVDRSITDILGGATHVVLYHFHDASQSWEKSDVEGSLSLAVRDGNSSSRHVLVILNRNSPENYPMDFTSDFQLQKSDPFLIFKNYEPTQGGGGKGPATIRGIWFPNDNERDTMNDLLVGVLNSLKESPPPPAPAPVDRNEATASLFAALNIDGGGPSTLSQSQHQATAAARPPTAQANQQPILDKKSLQLALLSLIQDDRFLDLLHAQYLKVHNARASRN